LLTLYLEFLANTKINGSNDKRPKKELTRNSLEKRNNVKLDTMARACSLVVGSRAGSQPVGAQTPVHAFKQRLELWSFFKKKTSKKICLFFCSRHFKGN
jgi:hypothetical protein